MASSFADEAFAAKHMPELGHDVKDFQVYTWRLNNWKKLEKKLTSEEFECGGHKWSVIRVYQPAPYPCSQAHTTLPLRKLQCSAE